MAAVILPTQLSAQTLSSGELAGADSALPVVGDSEGIPFFFADLLAQQLGLAGGEYARKGEELVDIKEQLKEESSLQAEDIAAFMDPLIQAQQEVVMTPAPLVAPLNIPLAQGESPDVRDENPVSSRSDLPAISALRDSLAAKNGTTEIGAERQSVAVATAAFADAEAPQVPFTVSSEGIAEQAGRSVAINVTMPAATSTAQLPIGGAIAQPVTSPAWGDVLGDRVMWMVGQQQQGAELRLNPPSLGPLEIKLSMTDGQATLTFSTQHLPVKEALDAATPRLREMFGESGINLGSVSVNVGTSGQQQQADAQQSSRHGNDWSQAQPENDFTSMLPAGVTQINRSGNGMVDYFA